MTDTRPRVHKTEPRRSNCRSRNNLGQPSLEVVMVCNDAPMAAWTIEQVAGACRASWSVETCDPVDLPLWSETNRARGQCGVTALVINDLCGGDLILAEVLRPDGSRQGVHFWNRLPDGSELDLTRSQFTDGEQVQPGRVMPRPGGPPLRCAEQYTLLRDRVLAHLTR